MIKNKLDSGMAALKKVDRNISPFVKIGSPLCRSSFMPELAIKPTTQAALNYAKKASWIVYGALGIIPILSKYVRLPRGDCQ